jgi:3'-phosphoadenosine 5'-phosphosulfate sulfotransferase (PAPS reductase)/FAD synthetase
MPRSKFDPNRLSNAWKEINKLDKRPLEEKINYSIELIHQALHISKNPTISWSGGKDSTVVLHLVRQRNPKIPIIFADLDCLFPETRDYVLRMSKEWKLNLHFVKSKEYNFKTLTEKYGFPLFSKNIASNVERAVRTGNLREQLSSFEKFLVLNHARISTKCSQYLLEKPCKVKEAELCCDLKFVGLRALESRARVRLWADYGDLYSVKHYYGKHKPIYKCNPISTWSSNDIWEYHRDNNIPICDIYRNGYERNGCWTCGMAIRNGQLNRLKNYNPALYDELIETSEMGKEIRRLKLLMDQTPDFYNYIKLPE